MAGFKFDVDSQEYIPFCAGESAGVMIARSREQFSRTQANLAEDLCVSVRTVQAWEQNRRSLIDASFTTVMRFSLYCQVPVSDIFAWYCNSLASCFAASDHSVKAAKSLIGQL